MNAATSSNIPVRRSLTRRRSLARVSAAALLGLTLSFAPVAVPQAQAANASVQAMEREAAERAERRRPFMVLFPAGVAVLTLVLVLTVKRRR
ncbi:hypothetical protein [Alcanivorax quisquiliarum]|uniref:MYXO-CTERM domain-containing protein n=1 Tax=Alcanivorax quisquiliarum TaxID=2933565 RepID=A0ABT0E6N1_9GAMM|nr:hypothetical protein [Alcanivorax quisquiliarum]MCK0537489.1 hypothetical protein [Alcanivorax quisquiliarum]